MGKETFALLLVLLVSVAFLSGCTQQNPGANQTPPANQPPAQNPPPSPPPANVSPPQNQTYIGMDEIYMFGSVRSYEYLMTSQTAAGFTSLNVSSSVTSDTINGTAAWLEETDMMVQNSTVVYKTWIDKITFKCLKISSSISYGGQQMTQDVPCPTEGPNSASRTDTSVPQLSYVGKESVTVPAGTFNADKYYSEGVTYWTASGVPVPVKISYNSGQAVMELVSYS